MLIKSEIKFLRTGPRKIRLVADLVRPMSVADALTTLKHLPQRGAVHVLKLFEQAIANAVNNHNLRKDVLSIHTLEVNSGPAYKRFQPVSRGRAHSILKRTSHLKLVLESVEPEKPKEAKNGTKS
ncbi:MAG: 50S ribosomal protein L22 [Candidatus Beckwithbacteria bacterium]